jgi:hypothetical protein
MTIDERVLENVRLAAGCGAGPSMLLSVALASLGATSIQEALAGLDRLREEILQIERDTPRPHRKLAELEPFLVARPPVARMRLEIRDHELRGRLVFRELVPTKSFMQVAALSIANVELTESDGKLLDEIGVAAQLADPRIWPLAVARRISASGGSLAEAVTSGLATLCTPQMTGLPAAGFMRFLDRIQPEVDAGRSVERVLLDSLEKGERIPGVGRPVILGVDERVPPMLAAAERHGRANGHSVTLARELHRALHEHKGLGVNSAGVFGAIARDLGFTPDAAAAFCLIYFLVPILTHSHAKASASEGAAIAAAE